MIKDMNNQEKLFLIKQANIFKRLASLLGGSKGPLSQMSGELSHSSTRRRPIEQVLGAIRDARNTSTTAFGGFVKFPSKLHMPGTKFDGVRLDELNDLPGFEKKLEQAQEKARKQKLLYIST